MAFVVVFVFVSFVSVVDSLVSLPFFPNGFLDLCINNFVGEVSLVCEVKESTWFKRFALSLKSELSKLINLSDEFKIQVFVFSQQIDKFKNRKK